MADLKFLGKIQQPNEFLNNIEAEESDKLHALQCIDIYTDLSSIDFELWDIYSWLSDADFRYVLAMVVNYSYKRKIKDALIIEAIINELSGYMQKTKNRNLWVGNFDSHWKSLNQGCLNEIECWLDFLLDSEISDDEVEKTKEAKATLNWLKLEASNPICL